jgi:hypothetical protein
MHNQIQEAISSYAEPGNAGRFHGRASEPGLHQRLRRSRPPSTVMTSPAEEGKET